MKRTMTHENDERPKVCELYAGCGAMSAVLETLGCQIVCVCEREPHLKALLEQKFPGASVRPDVRAQPWIEWAECGKRADVLVAGVPCQPFSNAGLLREQNDARAFEALLVVEAACKMQAQLVLLENVPGLITNDQRHRVYTVIQAQFASQGFPQHKTLTVRHDEVGGRTSRNRVFLAFARAEARVNWEAWEALRATPPTTWPHGVPMVDTDSQPWGPVTSGRVNLARDGIMEGCVVMLQHRPECWRVMRVRGSTLWLMSTDRTCPTTTKCEASELEAVDVGMSTLSVKRLPQQIGTITTRGEPPRHGAELVELQGQAHTMGVAARFVMHAAPMWDLQFLLEAGCSTSQVRAVAGGMVPPDMARAVLEPLLRAWKRPGTKKQKAAPDLRRTLEPAQWHSGTNADDLSRNDSAAGHPGPPEHSLVDSVRSGGDTKPLGSADELPTVEAERPAEGQACIMLIPVDVETELAQVAGSRAVGVLVPASSAVTGKVIEQIQHLLPETNLVVAGRCQTTEVEAWVVAALGAPRQRALRTVRLSQLEGTPLHAPVALALARALSFKGLCTQQDLEPLLGKQQGVAGGAQQPKHLPQGTVGSAARSPRDRREALQEAQAKNTEAAEALLRAAELTSEEVNGESKAEYLRSWALQIPDPEALYQQLPEEAFRAQKFDHGDLRDRCFKNSAPIPETQELPPVPDQAPLPEGFSPRSVEDLFTKGGAEELETAVREQAAFLTSLRATEETPQQLAARRPKPKVLGTARTHPQARGRIFDLRSSRPELMDLNAKVSCKLNVEYFEQKLPGHRDQQMAQFMRFGVRSQAKLKMQNLVQPHLLSLANQTDKVTTDLKKLEKAGKIQTFARPPFFPIRTNSMGARPKRGSIRRISDMGQPRKELTDEDGESVDVYNRTAAMDKEGQARLPKEHKALSPDMLSDMAALRYIADQLGWTLYSFSDDLEDFFRQFAIHPSELWMMPFIWFNETTLAAEFKNESRMGFGLVHASNVAQRFANAVVHIFLREFEKVDRPYLEKECAQHPLLREWILRRRCLPPGDFGQARLIAAAFYTDDLLCFVLGESRFARAISVWFDVTRRLGLACSAPEKRVGGVIVPWCGLIYTTLLGGAAITADKAAAAQLTLATAATGKLPVAEYRSIVGLIEWARFGLMMPPGCTSALYGPMRRGGELGEGPATWVRPTDQRLALWKKWANLMMTATFAPAAQTANVTPTIARRLVVWHADAAIRGTKYPALCGFWAGLYWVFPLPKRLLNRLHITALELLAQLGNFLVFGPMLRMLSPDTLQRMTVLLQCDSLVSTQVLTANTGRHRLSLTESGARSPVLKHIHEAMLENEEVKRLQQSVVVGHIYGEGNVMADAGSRGNIDLLHQLCGLCGLRPKRVPIPAEITHAAERAARINEQNHTPHNGHTAMGPGATT